MKKLLRLALLGASALALSAGAALADYELNILHINDFHSRIEAINKYDSTCSAEEEGKSECFGGIARMKTAIDQARSAIKAANGNVLVLDAGDQAQGSLFYSTYKTKAIADFMNGIGFDAMAVGNHEFDDGPEELAKFIDAAKFPIISGNVMAPASSPVGGKLKPYVIADVGGQKVAILSVLATDTPETSSPGPSILFEDEITYLKAAVKDVEAQGVNKIVLLSHVGYPRDKQIAAAVDGIDVIVGAHSHTLLSNTDEKAAGPYPTMVKDPAGIEVPVVTAYAYSKYLGELKLVFDDAGKVKSATGAPKLLDASVKPDEAYVAKVKELGAPIEALKAKVIGASTAAIDGSRDNCRARECEMGNLVADAMLDRVKDQGIEIAFANGGGLRASIDGGDVSMGEVLTVLPFQNTIATFQLKGEDVVAALESGVSQVEEGKGRFPQVAGLKFAFDASKPAGSRVSDVQVKDGDAFKPIDPAKTYGVVANNYTRQGGDGYKVFAEKAIKAYDFGPSLEDTVADYIGKNSPYKPYLDGRITELAKPVAQPAAEVKPAAEAKPATEAKPAAETAPAAAPAATEAAKPTETKHVIAKGDTFWDLAEKFYGTGFDWKKIAEANKSLKPRALPVGGELTVPAK
ncbi:5'-nucleotidase/UDP-sugar diphosphatase [Rhizobium sp. SG_E_25_P2]|uniref:5'-nucleotidase C-terminal domain-containing protein n=1 Tax=Rhizobium sp. SG_E_25_P2 TaxID=2879942 RepID=UPI002475A7E9|nr:5'-nucleotidase C-terminal domain-containing protein [Rhizobium sp. SG_E_25_P2]MDH6265583.1 5'-nucleotidase/UDP-sugar diphosphatase [Rhizobium sp. SG_E_25_P2]